MDMMTRTGLYIKTHPGEVPPDGYEVTDNPCVFVLKIPKCRHRDKQVVTKACCGKVSLMFCKLKSVRTTRIECHSCGVFVPPD